MASLVGAVNLRLDLLIMSLFLSATAVGLYGLANSVMVVLTAVPSAGGILLLRSVAWNSEVEGSNKISQLHRIRRGARRYFLLTAALGVGVFVFAPLLIHLLLGPSYAPSIRLIQILTPGYVARAYVVLATLGAVGARRPRIGIVSEGAALVVTGILLALLLPRYGATGAAIASTSAYATAAVVSWMALQRAQRG
jgi:O-antigen/teichoic acid export membrane protein